MAGSGFERLEAELMQARAEALGRAGRRLEQCLARYRGFKSTLGAEPNAADREHIAELWNAVLRARDGLIIVREANGIHRHDAVDRVYGSLAQDPDGST
jgi:hypothetical protein